jgi:hypothetical protein
MRRSVVIGITAGAAAATIAVGVIWWLVARPPSAEDTAEAYLQALSEGDADAVASLLHEVPGDFPRTAEAFAGADSYVDDHTFALTEQAPDLVSVRAEVELGGEQAVVGFLLGREGGRWVVTADYAASLEVATTLGDSVLVGGVLMPAAAAVPLLPAVYTLTPAPAEVLDGVVEVAVTNEAPVRVEVEASVSPDATALAQAQLDAYLDACAERASSVPENCGLRVPWAVDLASLDTIAFRIDQRPVLALADDAQTFDATGGDIVATAQGTTRAGTAGTFTYRADDWAVRGSVSFAGDEMILAVR